MIREFIRRMSALRRGKQLGRELDEELRFHVEEQTEANIAAGMAPEEARRQALVVLGGIDKTREEYRDALGFRLLSDLAQDVRYALRQLRRSPGFTAVAVLTLALGIGANTVIFSVVNAVLLRPLPYPQPDHLVKVWGNFSGIGIPNDLNRISAPEFKDLDSQNRSFSHIAAIAGSGFNLNVGDRPERIRAALVSPSLFQLLGVQAMKGRTFAAEESAQGRDKVILLSYGLWKRGFGGDSGIVGRTLDINAASYEVVGVMPPGFQYPEEVEIWAPLFLAPNDLVPARRGAHGFEVLARIKPNLTIEQARADMAILTRAVVDQNRDYPYAKFQFAFVLTPLLEEMVRDTRKALWMLSGAIALVLLIACANVASLLLVRASAREREIAVRMALGADRGRLVRQLLTESVLLALAGGAAGLCVAGWGLRVLVAACASVFPRVASASIDGTVLAFTMALSAATGIVFGLAPAFYTSSDVHHESLKDCARISTSRRSSQRLKQCLVAGELALSLVLLNGAGLLMKSFVRLHEVDPGFQADQVMTLRIPLLQTKYGQPGQIRAFYGDVLDRVSGLPGVQAVGAIDALPFSTSAHSGTVTIETTSVAPENAIPETDWRAASAGYFQAMGIPLVRGRFLDRRDTEFSLRVALVDETMANTYWPGEDPIGRRLHLGGRNASNPDWATVVGVVRHVRYRTLEALSRVQVYFPATQVPVRSMSLAIRTAADPTALAGAVRKQILAVDPSQPIYQVQTMQDMVEGSLAKHRLSMFLLSVFAAAALLLSAIGIYGVISYWVSQRTREIGIRVALGAGRLDVLKLVMHESVLLVAAGAAAGFLGSLALNRSIASLLFGVKASDPLTFVMVAVLMAIVALAASALPAHRAMQVHPMVALRYE